ncbi:MIR motif-containing protein [Gilbertella persicaria]|uniref:MIR motif-containing protein n=1 Tax=Gilbertella persicaria TaxID=101096 RepID=UPI00221FF476|nr:MIR motif-containing protein [Gilbertella persicaria]KAI8097799.1 MIR motif-containing protein [Gilbertella persicaria]
MSDEVIYGSRPDGPICFGSHISLKHNMSGRYLTSEGGRHYDNGSGQQVVFTGGWEATPETTFIVIPRLGDEIDSGDVEVNFGDVIRLKHMPTRTNLHSHPDIPSPVTEQQEVTCFGDDFNSDENDEWIVEQWTFDDEENEQYDEGDNTWYTGRSFFLRHKATGVTLHSHDESLDSDNNEVTGYGDGPDENDRWRVVFY